MRNEEHPFSIIIEKADNVSKIWEWFCVHKEHAITPLANILLEQWFDNLEEELEDGSVKTYFVKI